MTSNKTAKLAMDKLEFFERAVIFMYDSEKALALFPMAVDMTDKELKEIIEHNELDDSFTVRNFRKIMSFNEDEDIFEYQWLYEGYIKDLRLAKEDEYSDLLQELLNQRAITLNSVLNIDLEEEDDL